MGATLTTFDAALKIDYLPYIREQLNHSTVLLDKAQRNTEDVYGKNWYLTVHHSRNSGVGARAENGALPTAGSQGYKNPYGGVKYNYGRINLPGPLLKAARANEGAIVRALNSEIQGVTRDLKKEINTQLFGDGTAVRALVNGDPSTGTTLTLDNPGTLYMQEGMKIDIVDASTGTVEDEAVVISSVDSDTQVTVSAALDANIEDNSKVVRYGATDGAGTSYEMMGLKGIVDDGTYAAALHNINRTTYPWFKCSTFGNDDNSGTNRDLTTSLMQEAMTAVEKNGGKVDAILCSYEVRDAYASELVADKRFVDTMELDGGWTGLKFNDVPVIADPDCPPNTMFFVDFDHLFLMQMSDFDWMDEDGAILSRVSGYDQYEAVLYLYAEFATDRPRAFSFLRDVE